MQTLFFFHGKPLIYTCCLGSLVFMCALLRPMSYTIAIFTLVWCGICRFYKTELKCPLSAVNMLICWPLREKNWSFPSVWWNISFITCNEIRFVVVYIVNTGIIIVGCLKRSHWNNYRLGYNLLVVGQRAFNSRFKFTVKVSTGP